MKKHALIDYPIHELIQRRWSPRAFSSKPIEAHILRSLFEAARWSASSYNDQPWRFIVATRDKKEEFAQVLECLSPFNQEWAQNAPVILISVASRYLTHNGKENRVAVHDLGLAVAQMVLQAVDMGLVVCQMVGFYPERARKLYQIPESFLPIAGIAIGYPGDPDTLSEKLQPREKSLRVRNPHDAFVFSGTWEKPLQLPNEKEFDKVLSFWFGPLDEDGLALPVKTQSWWTKDEIFDQNIRDQFLTLYEKIVAGEREDWLQTPKGRLAYLIVLDQFSRNMFRDQAKMYAADLKAQEITLEGIQQGMNQKLTLSERQFFYMPLMHSETLSHQEKSVSLFATMQEQFKRDNMPKPLEDSLYYPYKSAIEHRDIVKQWGRFPHRNKTLGRTSTKEELVFLTKEGSSF